MCVYVTLSYGQRSLVDYSLWGPKESDTVSAMMMVHYISIYYIYIIYIYNIYIWREREVFG